MIPYYSIIIPTFNEEGNVEALVNRLVAAFSQLKRPWEVLFIDDGSTDHTVSILERLKDQHPQIQIIRFSRNFGQTAAFAAGFDFARGKRLITMDADLQNDPADIPRMLKLMKAQQADIVAGWRRQRQDAPFRSLLSRTANFIITLSTNSPVHDLGCSLKLYKRSVVKQLKLYGEMHRFIPILAAANGAKVIETEVQHHPRHKGQSKYGLMRTFKVILDLLTVKFLSDYQTKPIYIFGFAGMSLIGLGLLGGVFVIIRRLFLGGMWVSPLFFVTTTFFNVGVVCILMGLLAEIQVRTWFESSGKKSYILKK